MTETVTTTATTTIYGASDDLIEVEGLVTEEFSYHEREDEPSFIAFSDGTVVRIEYTDAGVWRIAPVRRGRGTLHIEQAPEDDEKNYTDRATLIGDVEWVVYGHAFAGR
jgi:hypothetical protein